jgi:uncharacterized protein (TIGR02466 family)
MPVLDPLFVTKVYRAELGEGKGARLNGEIEAACLSIAEDDTAGQRWCAKNGYPGYTSYASLNDLPWRVPVFGELKRPRHPRGGLRQGARLRPRTSKLQLDSLWINILPPGGSTPRTSTRIPW